METLKPVLKRITAYLSIFLILLPGCRVYYDYPSSLDEVLANENTRVEVTTNTGLTFKYQGITDEDSSFYGIQMYQPDTVKIKVSKSSVEIIQVKMKFKVIFSDGITKEYDGLILYEDHLSGMIKHKSSFIETPIEVDQIESVHLLNKGATIRKTVLAAVGLTTAGLITAGIIYIIFFGDTITLHVS